MADINKFINNLKTGFSVITDEAEHLTRGAISKTSDIVDQTRINFAVREIENKINDAYVYIGKCVYNQFRNGGESGDDIKEKCEFILECENEADELKKEIAQLKNVVICSKCGKYTSKNSKYCPECGAKITQNHTDD